MRLTANPTSTPDFVSRIRNRSRSSESESSVLALPAAEARI